MKTNTYCSTKFDYLLEKINLASFKELPFRHLIIEEFLSKEHFHEITSANQLKLPAFVSTEELIQHLIQSCYEVQKFPGATTSIEEYISCYNSKMWPTDKTLLEGFGLVFRLRKYKAPILAELIDFLNSEKFKRVLENKLEINTETYVETAIQKYLHGYEISPHPDVRKKAATYMLNINTYSGSENDNIHTYLLRFKPQRKYIYDFWRYNLQIQRCWVPWDWCDICSVTNLNNSVVLFAPSDDTLHGVKLSYNHLTKQRTQVYGNLWYKDVAHTTMLEYDDINLLANTELVNCPEH